VDGSLSPSQSRRPALLRLVQIVNRLRFFRLVPRLHVSVGRHREALRQSTGRRVRQRVIMGLNTMSVVWLEAQPFGAP